METPQRGGGAHDARAGRKRTLSEVGSRGHLSLRHSRGRLGRPLLVNRGRSLAGSRLLVVGRPGSSSRSQRFGYPANGTGDSVGLERGGDVPG